jgi:hypothetical protein
MTIKNAKEKQKITRSDELIVRNYKGCCGNDKVKQEIIRRWWANGKNKGNDKLTTRENEEWLIYDRLIIVGIYKKIESCMNDGGQQGVKVDTIERKKKVMGSLGSMMGNAKGDNG